MLFPLTKEHLTFMLSLRPNPFKTMYKLTAFLVTILLSCFFSNVVNSSPPVTNDECTNATALTVGVTNTTGTVKSMSTSTGIPVGCATGTPDDDSWYMFTITSTQSVTVTLSNIGSNLISSGAMLQLFSGCYICID